MPCSSDQEQFYRHKDTLLADPLSLGQFFCVFAVVNHWNMFQVETALTQKKELDVKKKQQGDIPASSQLFVIWRQLYSGSKLPYVINTLSTRCQSHLPILLLDFEDTTYRQAYYKPELPH